MARAHADALRSMRRIYLDAGRATSTTSTSARRRSRAELEALGVEHTLELFDGKHGGLTYRYPGAIRELVRRSVRERAVAVAHQASTAGHGP